MFFQPFIKLKNSYKRSFIFFFKKNFELIKSFFQYRVNKKFILNINDKKTTTTSFIVRANQLINKVIPLYFTIVNNSDEKKSIYIVQYKKKNIDEIPTYSPIDMVEDFNKFGTNFADPEGIMEGAQGPVASARSWLKQWDAISLNSDYDSKTSQLIFGDQVMECRRSDFEKLEIFWDFYNRVSFNDKPISLNNNFFISQINSIDMVINKDYSIFFIFFMSAFALSLVVGNVSRLVGNSTIIFDRSKISAYECGFQPFEQLDKSQLFIFYRLAVFFIIFESELVFLFPWLVNVLTFIFFNEYFFFYSPFIFIVILIYGFFYEMQNKALDLLCS